LSRRLVVGGGWWLGGVVVADALDGGEGGCLVRSGVCRSVGIAGMEGQSTIGFRRRVRDAEDGVRIVRFALKGISREGSAGSANVPVAGARSTYR
jgi:hypothetical protein